MRFSVVAFLGSIATVLMLRLSDANASTLECILVGTLGAIIIDGWHRRLVV